MNDSNTLNEMLQRMENRRAKHREVTGHDVTANRYFPIFKLYIHLKILQAQLNNEASEVLNYVNEARNIKEKMGFWTSMFNVPYFYNEYAKVLIQNDTVDIAADLLKEAIEYNPNYAPALINMAKIHLKKNNLEEAKKEYRKTRELLLNADEDYILFKELEEFEKELSSVIGKNWSLFVLLALNFFCFISFINEEKRNHCYTHIKKGTNNIYILGANKWRKSDLPRISNELFKKTIQKEASDGEKIESVAIFIVGTSFPV